MENKLDFQPFFAPVSLRALTKPLESEPKMKSAPGPVLIQNRYDRTQTGADAVRLFLITRDRLENSSHKVKSQ